MMGDGMQMSGTMWIGMILWGVLLLALIALAIAGTMRLLRGNPSRTPSAREELDLRYARGELDREKYVQSRDDLASDR